MNWTKLAALTLCSCMLWACTATANQRQDTDMPRLPKQDPVIKIEARKNYKLYKQTEKQMLKSRRLPDITYEFDSIRPPDYAYPFLDKLAVLLTGNPQLHLIIEGHTDIIGGEEYNYWLSASRAAAMKSYLVSRGVPADVIRIHGYGKDRPLTYDTSDAGRRTNRRVAFKLTTRTWNAVY